MATSKVETVECELSARIRPGDRKCLAFYRSFAESTCRACDLADKIEKLINPVEIKMDLDALSVRRKLNTEDEPAAPVEIALTSGLFKLKGKFVPMVFTNLDSKKLPEDLIIQIRGCTKGFREPDQAKSARGKLTWFVYRPEMLDEISNVQYYEIQFSHKNPKVVSTLLESYLKYAHKAYKKTRELEQEAEA